LERQDELILDHIGRYTLSIKRVIDTACLEGTSCQNSLTRLLKAELIQGIDRGLSGNFRYYQLTTKGAKARAFPVNRAREKEPRGLAQDLATLWFSCMGGVPRMRLADSELQTLFGAPKGGNIIHVAQSDGDDSTVFRLFIPSENSSLNTFLATLKKSAYDAASDERLIPWIERGTYQLAVLLQNQNRREELERLVRKEKFADVRLLLDIAPSPTNLKEFISAESN
jgi:hypothetical protein